MTWRYRSNLRDKIHDNERETEDEIARRKLGPRGEPNVADTAAMTPQRQKKLPQSGAFDGHTA